MASLGLIALIFWRLLVAFQGSPALFLSSFFFGSEEATHGWYSRNNLGGFSLWIIFADTGDCQVNIGIIVLFHVSKLREKCLHDFLLLLGFLWHAHNRVEVNWCATFHDITDF